MPAISTSQIKDSFYTVIEKISDYAVFLMDTEGVITYWNNAAEQIKGYSASEAIGQHFRILYPDDAQECGVPEHNLQMAAENETFQEEALRKTKSGRLFWAMTELIAIRDEQGALTGFCKVTRDVTRFHVLKERLELEKQRAEVTLDAIGDGVISVDSDGKVDFVNRKAEQITGWSASTAQGRDVDEVLNVVDKSQQRSEEAELACATSELVGTAIAVVENSRGARRIIENTTSPVCLAGGEKVGDVMVFRDVTPRQVEAKEMRDAERNKDQFLATLAHELRNPLAPILSAASMLQQETLDAGGVQRMAGLIVRQGKHLLGLVDDLLDVSRIAQGEVRLDIQPHAVQPILQSAIEQIQPMLDQKAHRLTLALPSEPVYALCDLGRMIQVVANILNNAVRYTNPGGNINVELVVAAERLVLSISDDGMGISPDMLPRVFDLFVQEVRANEGSTGGLGIGLALVRNLMELQGGDVRCQSEGKGRGSRFTLRLVRYHPDEAGAG